METLDKKLHKRLASAAKKLGLNERDMINRAVSAYLFELGDWDSLHHELRAWDVLSARTMQTHKF